MEKKGKKPDQCGEDGGVMNEQENMKNKQTKQQPSRQEHSRCLRTRLTSWRSFSNCCRDFLGLLEGGGMSLSSFFLATFFAGCCCSCQSSKVRSWSDIMVLLAFFLQEVIGPINGMRSQLSDDNRPRGPLG